MHEQEMTQSEWSLQKFKLRTMYIHRFYPTGGCHTALQLKSRYLLNIQNDDDFCLLWNLIAYFHPANNKSYRVSNYIKREYINTIKLPDVAPPYDLKQLRKIHELIKDKVLFNLLNLNKNKTVDPVLINHNHPKRSNILFWGGCLNMSSLLRKTLNNKCYPRLRCFVSFRIEDELNKHLDLCNESYLEKDIRRRTFHKENYVKFNKLQYKNKVPFITVYDFEFIMKYGKPIPVACAHHIKNDYPDILESKLDYHVGGDSVYWCVSRVEYHYKLFGDVCKINILLKEETVIVLTTDCYYCKEELGDDCVRDYDHLNGVFRVYVLEIGTIFKLLSLHLFPYMLKIHLIMAIIYS